MNNYKSTGFVLSVGICGMHFCSPETDTGYLCSLKFSLRQHRTQQLPHLDFKNCLSKTGKKMRLSVFWRPLCLSINLTETDQPSQPGALSRTGVHAGYLSSLSPHVPRAPHHSWEVTAVFHTGNTAAASGFFGYVGCLSFSFPIIQMTYWLLHMTLWFIGTLWNIKPRI